MIKTIENNVPLILKYAIVAGIWTEERGTEEREFAY